MASAPSEPRPVFGRLDADGRLLSADPQLEALQREAGSAVGQPLALPQVAAIAELARKLGTTVSRPAIAASADHDIDLLVSATPDGDQIALTLEGWTMHAPSGPRLAAILGRGMDGTAHNAHEWTTDEELRIISLSPALAERVGVDATEISGAPLTRVLRLEEDENGDMPLISALATRKGFSGQHARSRADDGAKLVLSGEVVTTADGTFAGFRGTAARLADAAPASPAGLGFDADLEALLRSPVDRIIDSAEQIATGAEGPLRPDYASYGHDIASAARHLMSVLRSMKEGHAGDDEVVELASLSAEAVIMLESTAEERLVTIDLGASQPLRARGKERGVIQILVNLIVNAIRHSPEGGTVRLSFTGTAGTASVSVADEGTGIPAGDEQRIFERFEQGRASEGGTGLGLAISRRLARSMGGDVTLDSGAGEGARFTLTLPAA